MSYCSKCGSYIPDSALKCPACGKLKIGAAETAQQAQAQSQTQGAFGAAPQRERSQWREDVRPKQDPYAQYQTELSPEERDAEENKALGAISYLGPLVILSLLLKPNSPFVRFHANQSIALIIFSVLCSICSAVPFFGWMIGMFGGVFTLVNVFKGFFGALNGKRNKLPIVGDMHILGKQGEGK